MKALYEWKHETFKSRQLNHSDFQESSGKLISIPKVVDTR